METSSQICYNLLCKDPKSDSQRRKGWLIRSGDHAQLCDRCYVAYEQGIFCEIFHAEAEGWRKCEACGKRVHCGCIVSASSYVLLDAGGIDCVTCARKSIPMGSSNAWPSTLLSYQMSDRSKEQPVKSWSQMAGSYPGQWRQGPHLWNTGAQSDLQQRLSLEFDRPFHSERRLAVGCPSKSRQDKKVGDPSSLNHVNHNLNPTSTCNLQREEHNNLQESLQPKGENDRLTNFSVVNFDTHQTSHAKLQSTDPVFSGFRSNITSDSANGQARISISQSQQQMGPMISKDSKQVSANAHNMNDASVEARNTKTRADARPQAHLLSRYQPRITDQELRQISGDLNSVITPLFEKILSASDAGRIGRLVLPKKCAETYFPPITNTEGLPLKVQDSNGKEWTLQFRYWPNNKSRMYVLEGITPFIQSMQLVAGDTVTFSRIDPEGKLVIGFRKAIVLPDQDTQIIKTETGLATAQNVNNTSRDNATTVDHQFQNGITESKNPASRNGHFDKAVYSQKDNPAPESSQGPKKRGRKLGSKSKRLRIDNQDAMELSLTWEEAQELLRPPPTIIPKTVVMDGHEIEEYEEAPVFGKPTIFTSNQAGEISQWAQCEDCFKWRKLPIDALLPCRFSCSENKWDAERACCSSPQVTSTELTDLIHSGSNRSRVEKAENGSPDAVQRLDTLENETAALEEGSSQQTTKHPRHRLGCSCIVCIQPPSCSGPKHKPMCVCNVCLAVKRRYQTLLERREKKQSEKETDTQVLKAADSLLPQNDNLVVVVDNECYVEDDKGDVVPSAPLMAKIDLNIQPEREEEISPVAANGDVLKPFADAAV